MAFPIVNVLLDDTTRTNETPWVGPSAQGYSFSGPVKSSQTQALLLSSNIITTSSNTGNHWRYCTTVFAADQQSYCTVSSVPTGGGAIFCHARIQNPNTANLNGYYIAYVQGSAWIVGRMINDDGGATRAVNNTTYTTLVAGDKIGIEVIGNAVTAYSYHSGVWTAEVTYTMTGGDIVSGAGYLGWEISPGNHTEVQLTNFTGGDGAGAGTGADSIATGLTDTMQPVQVSLSILESY